MRMIYVAAVAAGLATPAAAQTTCFQMTLDQALENASKKHGETPLFQGTLPGGETFIVTAKQDGDRSWTVMIVPAPGVLCIPAAGVDFKPMRNAKPAGVRS